MSSRVAGIDCGTNSIRLLIADPVPGGGLTDVHREMRVVRLGEGVDRTGALSDAALGRTRDALVDYASLISSLEVGAVRMVATSASRDASNAADFVAMVESVLGVTPEVITGHEEAALSFAGAVGGLPALAGGDRDPLLVADIGGGSSELVLGSASAATVTAAHSMNIGCVRMTERHVRSDPPTGAEIAAATGDIRAALDAAAVDVDFAAARSFVGVAGTVTTVVAIARGLTAYEPDVIHGLEVSLDDVRGVTSSLLGMTRADRAVIPVMHAGRVDVIGAGALVLQTIMDYVGANSVIASEHDILDGIALSLL